MCSTEVPILAAWRFSLVIGPFPEVTSCGLQSTLAPLSNAMLGSLTKCGLRQAQSSYDLHAVKQHALQAAKG